MCKTGKIIKKIYICMYYAYLMNHSGILCYEFRTNELKGNLDFFGYICNILEEVFLIIYEFLCLPTNNINT